MKLLPYFLYLVLLAFYEVILRDLISINHVSINLAAFMVLIVAMYKSEMASLWFGFFCGIVLVAGHPDMMGIQSGMLAAIGLGSYHVRRRLNLDSLSAKLLLILGGVLAHNLLTVILNTPRGLLGALWSPVLMGALYTELLAVSFFMVESGKVEVKKTKANF